MYCHPYLFHYPGDLEKPLIFYYSVTCESGKKLIEMSVPSAVSNDIDPLREERAGKVREVGSHAIWSLSSCKPSKYCIFKNFKLFYPSLKVKL